ncbi:unnamed protein product [Sphagnum troendelagicum]|uniref:Ran guanine nucleotide release factor n=1 Tax=Sphagnum troendelagicum TaxID=128251 RepID=A0ABP0UN77_9BRYO
MAVQGNSVFDDRFVARPLFGGAIMCRIPANFHDVSNVREVPNNQEAFVDPNRDESIIVELLELKDTVVDERSSRWFLQDLAIEQDSEQSLVVESENTITTAVDVPNLEASIPVNVTVGTIAIAKSRQGDDARNLVRVHLANIRLHGVKTDVVITVYEPLIINEWSQSAAAVGAGTTVPAALAGCMAAPDVLKLVLSTFKICDWSLFG